MDDAEAVCTLAASEQTRLCGKATLLATGETLQVKASCNNDPTLEIAVRRGNAALRMDPSAAVRDLDLAAGQLATIDLVSGKATMGLATFTADEIALFNVQLEGLATEKSLIAYGPMLLLLKSVPAGDRITAPNLMKSSLGAKYGSVPSTCQFVGGSAVFYPTDPLSSLPSLNGAACMQATATVYGVAIYQPQHLAYADPKFFKDAGGQVLKHATFNPPTTVAPGASNPLFTWDGSTDTVATGGGASPAPAQNEAKPGIYVAHFIYTLQPDPTPRIGLVAISLGGGAFPKPG